MPARSADREAFLADVIITALEGGIGYWATALRYKWHNGGEGPLDEILLPPAQIEAIVMEDDDEHHEELVTLVDNFENNEGRKPTAQDLLDYGHTVNDEPLLYKIDIDVIAHGIGVIKSGDHVHDGIKRDILLADNENDAIHLDADSADCIVQAGLFGKVVFG